MRKPKREQPVKKRAKRGRRKKRVPLAEMAENLVEHKIRLTRAERRALKKQAADGSVVQQLPDDQYWAVVRETDGKRWVDIDTLACIPDQSAAKGNAADKLMPMWSAANYNRGVFRVQVVIVDNAC